MDTRLINQVTEWEWRIQMENEKNIHHPETYSYHSIILENCKSIVKSTLQQFNKLSRNRIFSIHSSEPA